MVLQIKTARFQKLCSMLETKPFDSFVEVWVLYDDRRANLHQTCAAISALRAAATLDRRGGGR